MYLKTILIHIYKKIYLFIHSEILKLKKSIVYLIINSRIHLKEIKYLHHFLVLFAQIALFVVRLSACIIILHF